MYYFFGGVLSIIDIVTGNGIGKANSNLELSIYNKTSRIRPWNIKINMRFFLEL